MGITIYADGGCSENPGPGGWASIIEADGQEMRMSGAEPWTTNNRMELTAVIEALVKLREMKQLRTLPVEVVTDSQYVQRGITAWVARWERNGWRTAARQPVKNKELWIRLKQLADERHIVWHWVRGHSGQAGNEVCHRMAQAAIKQLGA